MKAASSGSHRDFAEVSGAAALANPECHHPAV
jgi:hypothetical protein